MVADGGDCVCMEWISMEIWVLVCVCGMRESKS